MGIDGATFDLFEQWLPDLPTISSIIDDGISAPLESCTPPVTSPAWRCYATGKDPSSLGIYWWRQLDRETNQYVGAPDVPLRSKCYWEYLSDRGLTVDVLGIPLNTPPREVNGSLVLGGPYADSEDFTYPRALGETLTTRFNYHLHPTTDPASAAEPTHSNVVNELESIIHQRFEVAEWLREKDEPDLLNITLFYINHLQHMSWKSEAVKQLWETIDARLGKLLEEDDNILIHSDHGLHEVQRVFYLNAWLKQHGYLKLKETQVTPMETRLWNAGRRVSGKVGIQAALSKIIPDRFKPSSSEVGGRIVDQSDFESRIDFERSIAVGLPHGLVYVLSNNEKVKRKLMDELSEIVDSKQPVFSDILSLEEVYSNPGENSPDIFTKWNGGFEIKDISGVDPDTISGPPQKFKADNHPQGILLASGPDISEEGNLNQAKLYDLAPTILHLLGHPIPDDMDGKVLSSLFSQDSQPERNDVRTIPGQILDSSTQESTKVENRLRDLGYME
nr:alkaline phosphatase family protein [Haladaptatus sp. YSMS36]